MRFIIRSIRTKAGASGDYEEFDEFCESALRILDRSSFFAPDVKPHAAQPQLSERSLVHLLSALCVT